jgi:hypothetical protein
MKTTTLQGLAMATLAIGWTLVIIGAYALAFILAVAGVEPAGEHATPPAVELRTAPSASLALVAVQSPPPVVDLAGRSPSRPGSRACAPRQRIVATYEIEEVSTCRVIETVPLQITPEQLCDSVAGYTNDELQLFLNNWVQSDFSDNYILRPVEGASFISWARAVIAERERMEDTGPSALTAAQRNPTMGAQ